jgi:hypothetical protein
MNKIPLIDLAKKLSITPTQCRYWSKLCGIEIEKSGRISYLPESAERLLSAMSTAINGGLSPSVASNEVMATHAPVESPAPICTQDNEKSAARITELEKAVLLLAESNQAIIKQNQDLITQVKELAAKISHQSMKLDRISAKLPPPAPIKQPEQPKKPVVKVPLLKRLWLELFDPVKLRAI